MLSFFGKVFLLLAAAFGLGALAGKRKRSDGAVPEPVATPEKRNTPQAAPSPTAAVAAGPAEPAFVPATGSPKLPAGPAPEPEMPSELPEPVVAGPGGQPAKKPRAGQREDPLAAKHRAAAFDHDFRTLDYRSLSKDAAAREKERRARQHLSWQAKDPEAQAPSPPLQNAQFSQFGGSFVSAEIIRGRSTERVPDLMPTLPGDGAEPSTAAPPARRSLAGPDPRGPTPKREERRHLPEDPLAAKHRAAPFDKDFRTLDYRKLGSGPRPAPSPTGSSEQAGHETAGAEVAPAHAVFRIAGAAGTVPAVDVDNPAAGGEAGRREPPVTGEAVLAEEIMVREPARLDAPRAGTPDDLTRIDGIGTSLERLLFENGIYHYDQIARWGAGEAHWFEAKSGFPGRVTRERWVEQAQALVDDRATPRAVV
ncbi:MAG: hypothetical protein V7704_08980 [Aurantimonas endophytica]|uniref:hypothetical protein n=1 Tax=Aurantimonas endophytica TaxID=1522175 RepID=UPI003001CB53